MATARQRLLDDRALSLLLSQFPGDAAASIGRTLRALVGTAEGTGGRRYPITDVTTDDPRGFRVDSVVRDLDVGDHFQVVDSTANDGTYRVDERVDVAAGATLLVTGPPPPTDTVDGSVLTLPTWGIQECEDLGNRLLGGRTIAAARGVQLAGLGALVGLARVGADDGEYRAAVRLQAAINASTATPEELLAWGIAFAEADASAIWEVFPGLVILYLHGGTMPTTDHRRRLERAAAAGVRLWLAPGGGANPFVFGGDWTSAGVAIDPAEDVDGSGFGEWWPVTAVVAGGPGAGRFEFDNDGTLALAAAVTVYASVAQDGDYTVTGAVYNGGTGRTEVSVAEAVAAGAASVFLALRPGVDVGTGATVGNKLDWLAPP